VSGLGIAGQRIVSATSTGRVTIWTRKGEEVAGFDMPGVVRDLAVAPDGRHIATANYNGTVYIIRLPP
jgi:hypothetical protein